MELKQENNISGVAEKLQLNERIQKLDNKSDYNPKSKFKDFPELNRISCTLDQDAVRVFHASRRQPASLKPMIIEKLKEKEQDGYITKVNIPTEWVNSMVVFMKTIRFAFVWTRPT